LRVVREDESEAVRPKRLSGSGAHALFVTTGGANAQPNARAERAGRVRNPKRGAARTVRAALLLESFAAAAVSNADVGAALACDRDAARDAVRGDAPFDLGDLLLVVAFVPAARGPLLARLLPLLRELVGEDVMRMALEGCR
jgi:hypothetical protein